MKNITKALLKKNDYFEKIRVLFIEARLYIYFKVSFWSERLRLKFNVTTINIKSFVENNEKKNGK